MTSLPGWLETLYFVLLSIGAVGCWWFVARYVTTFRWYSTPLGAHLVVFSSIVGAWFTYFLAVFIWPDLPGKTAIRSALFVILTVAVVWRVVLFEVVRHQTKGKQK
jgi:hypothetical protein